jgi:hypothetical protein
MEIKHYIKEILFLNGTNAFFKARMQEKKAVSDLVHYHCKALETGIKLVEAETLAQALKQRLEEREISPVPKRKGDLHIFLAFSLSNWEYILPIALEPFGLITEFEWRSQGFDHNPSNWLQQRDTMNKSMIEAFFKANAKKPIDVVVGYLSGYNTDPAILQKMREAGSVILNFNWDDKLSFRGKIFGDRWTGPAALASTVDLNLTNAPDSCIKYMVEGGLAKFWPEAAYPDVYKPYNVPFEYDVSFVGGKYGWRPKVITRLRKMGVNVTCFGNGWENGVLSDKEMVKLYSRSRINLGFAGVGYSQKLMCLKGRDFEVPMSGGLYLTQDNPELSLVYDVGKEILTYRNEKDCAAKIKWILANLKEADEIRKAGRIWALKAHTWEKRFGDVFKMIGVI